MDQSSQRPQLGRGRAVAPVALLVAAGCLGWWGCAPGPRPPRLVVPETPLHLGQAAPGEELTGAFPLRNAGGQVLHLVHLEAGCGCAGLHLPQETIPPGGEIWLRVAVRIQAEGQHLSFPVRLHSNDPVAPLTVYTVQAEAAPPVVRAEPERIAFGEVPRGASPVRHLQLRKPGGTPWPVGEPVTVESERGLVAVETAPRATGEAGPALVVHVRPRADLPVGHLADTLTLRPAGSRRAVQVAVQGQVVPPLVVTPGTLFFGNLGEPAGPVPRYVQLRRTDGQPVPRLVRSTAPPGLQVDEAEPAAPAAGGPTRRVRVTLNPGAATDACQEAKVLLWLEGEPEPVAVGVMALLRRDVARTNR